MHLLKCKFYWFQSRKYTNFYKLSIQVSLLLCLQTSQHETNLANIYGWSFKYIDKLHSTFKSYIHGQSQQGDQVLWMKWTDLLSNVNFKILTKYTTVRKALKAIDFTRKDEDLHKAWFCTESGIDWAYQCVETQPWRVLWQHAYSIKHDKFSLEFMLINEMSHNVRCSLTPLLILPFTNTVHHCIRI